MYQHFMKFTTMVTSMGVYSRIGCKCMKFGSKMGWDAIFKSEPMFVKINRDRLRDSGLQLQAVLWLRNLSIDRQTNNAQIKCVILFWRILISVIAASSVRNKKWFLDLYKQYIVCVAQTLDKFAYVKLKQLQIILRKAQWFKEMLNILPSSFCGTIIT